MGSSLLQPGEAVCDYCGSPVTGTWTSTTRTLADGGDLVEHFHADTGPYKTVLPTCSMIVAELMALTARGWTPPPGCVGWQRAGHVASLKDIGAV